MTTKRNPLVRDRSEEGNPLTQGLRKLCLESRNNSLQSSEHMEVERQPSPQSIEERVTHTPQPTTQTQETHSMLPGGEKIVILSDPSASMNKDTPSPITTMATSPVHKPPQEGVAEMRSIVLISENHAPIPVSKGGHLMPPSPAHTPQPPPQTTQHHQMATDPEHGGVHVLTVYNERGEEVQDPIIQYVPNQGREESFIMKEESHLITCGNSKGEIFWKRFICPGINAKCVKCRNQWMTPKEFVQEAGKSTLKDWKRAIRINGTMLRKMIESGEVDYHQHETNCSNQCRSNKGVSLESSQGSFNHSFEISDTVPKDHLMSEGACLERSNSEDNQSFLNTKRPTLTVQRLSEGSKSAMSSLERSSSEDSGLAPSPQLDGVIMRESIATAEKVQDLQTFWLGIIRSDLFDEVIQDIVQQVSSIQHRAKTSPIVSAEDAVMLTNLANALELIPSIAQRTATHKMTVERQAEQSNVIIQDLERKLAEQKRFEIDLKRKSQHLESVMKMTPNEKRKRRNMMRLYRQKAVESRIPPSTQQAGPSAQSAAQRLTQSEMVGVVPTSLLPYPGSELWVPQSTAVAHALKVASNQITGINVAPGHMMRLPIPPHLLSPPHENFQIHQDNGKK